MQRKQYDVQAERFIEIWQRAANSDEVAKELGMPKEIVHSRAAGYRRKGVRLKKMTRRATNKLNIQELNRLIERLAPETQADDNGSIVF